MIQHIFKIIWTERKINSRIVFELVLVFCILWFCVDYLSFFVMRYFEPRGYTIEHVYNVNPGIKDESAALAYSGSQAQKDSLLNIIWTIVDRIKKHPDVEALSLSWAATPYSASFSNSSFMIDSVNEYAQIKTVTPDFFKVFGIKVLQGNPDDWNNKNNVFISGNKENRFAKKDALQVKTFNFTGGSDPAPMPVIGVAEPAKRSEFDSAEPIIYRLLAKNETQLTYVDGTEICLRVKAGADKDFISRFTKDIQEQIAIDPYFLSSITPMSDLRKEYMKWNGYDNNFKSIFSISTFLFINIFLAVVGTFWFRVQTRRSEIGLRAALGSSRMNIKALFIIETLILLLLASVIAASVCINIAIIDILKDIGVPAIDRGENPVTIGQYVINYCITFLILALIAIAAVWYPAQKASKIQPAEALRDE